MMARWLQRWRALTERDQGLLQVAVALFVAALLWLTAVAPAWKTLALAPAQHAALDQQLAQMHSLQAQALTLQSQGSPSRDEALQALSAALAPLGAAAQLAQADDRLSVTLKGVSADALAQLLRDVRSQAHLLPTEAHWVRNAAGAWDGSLVWRVPGR